jgi:hypothetical protein
MLAADRGLSMSNGAVPLTHKEVGLPEGGIVVQILHNRATQKTIVELQLGRSSPIHRLYWRASGQTTYHPLGSPLSEQSFESAVTCEEPLLFIRAVEWKPSGSGMGGTTLGVWRAELRDPPSIAPLDLSDTLPANAYVSRLLRANDGGTSLLAIVTFKKGGPGRYSVCTLDLANKQTIEHDVLPGILF